MLYIAIPDGSFTVETASANRSAYKGALSQTTWGSQFTSIPAYKSSMLTGDDRQYLSIPTYEGAMHTTNGTDQNLTLDSSPAVAMLLQEKIAAQAKVC